MCAAFATLCSRSLKFVKLNSLFQPLAREAPDLSVESFCINSSIEAFFASSVLRFWLKGDHTLEVYLS